jgi:hypothetical protein
MPTSAVIQSGLKARSDAAATLHSLYLFFFSLCVLLKSVVIIHRRILISFLKKEKKRGKKNKKLKSCARENLIEGGSSPSAQIQAETSLLIQ